MPDDHAWDRIVDAVDAKFGVTGHGRTTRPLEDKPELTERVAHIVFERGGGKFKLERVAGPAIIDRKSFGAKRIGSDVHFQNVYDPDETSFRTNLFREENGEWVSVNPEELGL